MKNIQIKPLLFILLLSATTALHGQSKRDHLWILGGCWNCPLTGENPEVYGGMYMRFDGNTQPTIEQFTMHSGVAMALANDEAGNLAFYSTGCGVYNKALQLMENGAGINPESLCIPDDPTYDLLEVTNGNIVLPVPEDSSIYCFFHISIHYTSTGRQLLSPLYLTKIDMQPNNGLGKVVSKNEVMITDSLLGTISAVRHANGRDWWLVAPRGTNRAFWKMLLTPEGIGAPVLQTLPPPYSPFHLVDIYETEGPPYFVEVPVFEYDAEANHGQAVFSPDGKFYCRVISGVGELEIYDFDRCTGNLNLRRVLPLPASEIEDRIYACGIAISPDSKQLYFTNTEKLVQLELSADSIANGTGILIDTYDGFIDFFPTMFLQMRNAPDGKIYIHAQTGSHYLHVINQPNQKGKACNFVQRQVVLPKVTTFSNHDFPNFNLGADPGSGCDTLHRKVFKEFTVFPNPSTMGAIEYYLPPCGSARIMVWNAAGQFMREIRNPTPNYTNRIETITWPSGVYFFSAFIDDQLPITRKVTVIR